jgi:CheY-like chemotaxis protein
MASQIKSHIASVDPQSRFNVAFSRLFTYLTPAECEQVLARAELIRKAAGEFIVHEGAPVKGLFLIIDGEVKVLKRNYAAGKDSQTELARLGLGSVFGEMSFLEHDLASATIVAERATQFYRITRADMQALIDGSAEFAAHFYQSLAVILSRRLRVSNVSAITPREASHAAARDRYRIFVVDDDPDILSFVKLFLEDAGHTVLTSTSAIEALSEISSFRPDVVITDLMMSGLDGLEFCKEMRKRRELRGVKIIMISVWSESVWTEKALEAGASGFIMKPLNPESFATQVEQIVRR